MIPVTRKEQYLNRLTGEEQAIPEEPITRTEQYLAKLCGMETEIPSSPITREEAYLAYLNGENVTLPEPITRLEQFMAFAAEKSETKPTPLTREELYWDKYQGGAVLKDFPGLPASIVTVTDALAKPLDSLKVAITPVQSGSGDPSPDNIRPIRGWTECNVRRNGKNLVDETQTLLAGFLNGNGTVSGVSSNYNKHTYKIPIKGGVTYTYSAKIAHSAADRMCCWYGANGTVVGSFELPRYRKSVSAIAPSNAVAVSLTIYNITGQEIQLEVGNTATSHEPYTGTIYTITFPSEAGTVYSGTLDVTNGVLTVTHGYISDLKTRSWTNTSTASVFVTINDIPGIVSGGSGPISPQVDIMCSKYQPTSKIVLASDLPDKKCTINLGGKKLVIADSSYSSVSDFTQSLSDAQFVYELATPITYQLTPTEVQMLLGTNNLWADTGDILEGKYWGKNPLTVTRAMLNTLLNAGDITRITPTEEPEENADER